MRVCMRSWNWHHRQQRHGRTNPSEDLLDCDHDPGRLLRIASRPDLKVVILLRDGKLPEEDRGYVLVVMLDG